MIWDELTRDLEGPEVVAFGLIFGVGLAFIATVCGILVFGLLRLVGVL